MTNTRSQSIANITLSTVANNLKKGNYNAEDITTQTVDKLFNCYGDLSQAERHIVAETISTTLNQFHSYN